MAEASAAPAEKAPAPAAAAVGTDAPAATGGNYVNDAARENEPFNFSLESGHRILSAADEAMLRDLGSGSGLLELTREALELQAGERSRSALAADPEPPHGDMSDRQFQVVGTALTMANRLVMVYKTELARARRLAMICWIAVAATAVLFVVVFWWGMSKSGSADVQRTTADNAKAVAAGMQTENDGLKSQLSAAAESSKQQIAKLNTDLDAARADAKKLQADLNKAHDDLLKSQQDVLKAREDFSKSESAAKIAAANLAAAAQRVTDLEDRISALKSSTTKPD